LPPSRKVVVYQSVSGTIEVSGSFAQDETEVRVHRLCTARSGIAEKHQQIQRVREFTDIWRFYTGMQSSDGHETAWLRPQLRRPPGTIHRRPAPAALIYSESARPHQSGTILQ
jgi:hypothetical protein